MWRTLVQIRGRVGCTFTPRTITEYVVECALNVPDVARMTREERTAGARAEWHLARGAARHPTQRALLHAGDSHAGAFHTPARAACRAIAGVVASVTEHGEPRPGQRGRTTCVRQYTTRNDYSRGIGNNVTIKEAMVNPTDKNLTR